MFTRIILMKMVRLFHVKNVMKIPVKIFKVSCRIRTSEFFRKTEEIRCMLRDAGRKCSIVVKFRPPVKGNYFDNNKERFEKLRQEAGRQLDYDEPITNQVKMKIFYYNGEGGDDLLNVEGGIADALEGIAYKNDRQIQSSCIEEFLVVKDPTWFKVELEFLDAGMEAHDGEFEKQGYS